MPQPTPPNWLLTVFRLPRHLYDHRLGWVLGQRFLLLRHTGRRSRRTYATVLEIVRHSDAGPEYVVVSGRGERADWLRNLDAGGPATMTVGRRTYPIVHRLLDAEEAIGVLAAYERRNRLIAPVLRRLLAALVGAPYRGTDADRRMLVAELPFVGLRPAPHSSPG